MLYHHAKVVQPQIVFCNVIGGENFFLQKVININEALGIGQCHLSDPLFLGGVWRRDYVKHCSTKHAFFELCTYLNKL